MRKFIYYALIGALIVSCTRDNVELTPPNKTPNVPEAPKGSDILPTKITHHYPGTTEPDEVFVFEYDEKEKNLLKKIGDGVVTYKAGLIDSVKTYEKFHRFQYDSNKNLVYEESANFYLGAVRSHQEVTYKYNGNTLVAEKQLFRYTYRGEIYDKTVSTITYTLDGQKRPIKMEEEYKSMMLRDNTEILKAKGTIVTTQSYEDHNNVLKNVKGFDNLAYSSFIREIDTPWSLISFVKKEENRIAQPSGDQYTFVYESSREHIVNPNNYITEIKLSEKNISTGAMEEVRRTTIEYNK